MAVVNRVSLPKGPPTPSRSSPESGVTAPLQVHASPKSRRWGGVHRRCGGVRLDARGHRRGQPPSSVWTRHGVVKQGQSRGAVGTISRGEGRGSRGVRTGQAGRGRARGGERLMGRRRLRRERQGCIRRGGTSEPAPEAVRQAVGGGCRSGWGRLLSVSNAVEAGTWR